MRPVPGDSWRRAAALLLAAFAWHAQAFELERIEPPNWWVGMKSDRLQLLVHGPGIGGAKVASGAADFRITGTQRVASPNYLFVDVRIAPGAKPRAVPLRFTLNGETKTVPYELQAREPGSAQRRGFGPADVMLNLMPDRFANGNPANDDMPGMLEKANRAEKSGGRHGGDIQGIIDHLDYIQAMGFTMLWPTPFTENNQPAYSYHGYAATDTYRIDARFGSNDDYRRLAQEAKRRGIGLVMDFVPNHIGSNHWWMRDLPMPGWINHGGRFKPTNHARTAVADPYASRADERAFTEGWFVDTMPDPDQRQPLLATYQTQNAIWWIEYAGLAGLRIDTYGYSDKDFLAAFTRRVMQEYPAFNMVGEEWSSQPVVVAHWLRGVKNRSGHVSSMPSMMDFPLHDALRRALVQEEGYQSGLNTLYETMVNDLLYPEPANLVLFEGNHDVPRLYSILDEDLALWRMALAYVLTMPRTPQLYYGTELLMTSPKQRDDGAVRQDFPGGWPGDTVNAFTGAGLSDRQREAQAFVKKLLNWRKTQPVVHHGRMRHFAPEDGTYVWFRHDAKGSRDRVMVVLNKAKEPRTLDAARFAEVLPAGASGTDVITGEKVDLSGRFTVPARTVRVLQVDR